MGGKHSRNRKNRPLVIVLSLAMIFSAMTAFWSFGDGGESTNSSVTINYDSTTGVRYIGLDSTENIVYCMNSALHWPGSGTYQLSTNGTIETDTGSLNLDSNSDFRKALAYILYAGYPKNGLGLCNPNNITKIDEDQFDKFLKVPDELKDSSVYGKYFSGKSYTEGSNEYTGYSSYSYQDYTNDDKGKLNNLYNFLNAARLDNSSTVHSTMFYKAAYSLVMAPQQYNTDPITFMNSEIGDNDSYYAFATQQAIWALMKHFSVKNNNSIALYGLADLLYKNALKADGDNPVLGHPKNISIVRADGRKDDAPEFTYSNGVWTSDALKVVTDGTSESSYNGTYTLVLPEGMKSYVGDQVNEGQPFKIQSETQPTGTVKISANISYLNDINIYSPTSNGQSQTTQNMVGATFGTKVANIELGNNTGNLTLTKEFVGISSAVNTSQIQFTLEGQGDISGFSKSVSYKDFQNGSYTVKDLPVGTYKITENGQDVSGYKDFFTVNGNSSGEVQVTKEGTTANLINTYKPTGKLTIHKTFVDSPLMDAQKSGITFTLQGQGDISGFSKTVSYKDFQNSSYTVKDLPVGTYKITESGADVSGYTDSLTVSVNGKTTGTIKVAKDGTTAELKNTYTPTGSLTIHKSFVNSPLTETQKNGITFTITGKNTNETRTVSFDKFSTDGKYTFTDLPLDTYTITESNAGGTVLTSYEDSAGNVLKDKQAAVSKGADTAVDVTNTYPSTPETPITVTPASADLRVQKLIIGNDGNWPEGASFTMNLQAKDNAPMPDGTVNGVKSITVSSESPASFGMIQYEKAGTYHYIVTESKGSDKNFTYDETQHPVTVTVTESADHKLTASISGGNSSGIVEISNHYTKPKEENGGKEENSGGNKTNGSTNNSSGKNSSEGSKTNGSTSSKTNGQVQPANTKTLKNSLAKTNPSGSAASSGNASGSLVRTGDQTDLAVMIALLLTSACGLAAVLALKKKRRDDRASEGRQ